MGCGGCLGPKKQIVEIYITLVNQIHEEALKVTSSTNFDLYMSIKQKITKKGYLRKLNDYLASHRGKISECFAYVHKTVQNRKQIQNRYAGIMIADSIVESTHKKIPENDQQKSEKFDESLVSSKENSIFMKPKNLSSSLMKRSPKKKGSSFSTNPGELTSEVNARIDEYYLRLINYLLQNENRMYFRILISLQNFCTLHTQKFRCEQEVWKAIRSIIKNLERNIEVAESIHGYYLLLSKLKDNPTQEMRNPHHLQIIVKLWLHSTRESDSQKLYADCREIIRIYINRCLASWDSEFIYQILMKIYDYIKFEPLQFQSLQSLYQEAVNDLDIKNQFFRGIFNYMLSYISVTHEQIIDQKWFAMTLGSNYEHLKSYYKNIMLENVKVEGFKVLNRWIAKGYINLEQFVLYNAKSLIFAYSSNLAAYRKNKKTCDIITDECFKIINKMCQQSQQIFKRRIIQELKQPKSIQNQEQILIKLLKQMLYRNKNSHEDLETFLIPLKEDYSNETNIQILKIIGFVIQNLNDKIQPQPALRNRLSQFLQSFYSNLANNYDGLIAKHQFCCACISFLKILATKYDRAILLAYVENINEFEESVNIDINRFFVQYLKYELAHILFKHIKVPDTMFKILQNILPQISSTVTQNLELQIGQYLTTKVPEKDMFDFDHLLKVSTFNKYEFQEMSKIFKKQFSNVRSVLHSRISYNPNQTFYNEIPLASGSQSNTPYRPPSFQRKNSVNNTQDNQMNDRSFEEVIDIIKL